MNIIFGQILKDSPIVLKKTRTVLSRKSPCLLQKDVKPNKKSVDRDVFVPSVKSVIRRTCGGTELP